MHNFGNRVVMTRNDVAGLQEFSCSSANGLEEFHPGGVPSRFQHCPRPVLQPFSLPATKAIGEEIDDLIVRPIELRIDFQIKK